MQKTVAASLPISRTDITRVAGNAPNWRALPITQPHIIGAQMDRAMLNFSLTGRSSALDARTDAFRPDLADIGLANRVFASHFASAVGYYCAAHYTPIMAKPDREQISELLQGEGFAVLDFAGGWAWGWSVHDHYVGYVRADDIVVQTREATSISPPADPLDYARSFLGMAYLWGGRGGGGIDCSGLVQRAFAAAGLSVPRDSDQQRRHLGYAIDQADARPGDLLFFPGHVGILADLGMLVHANQHHGKVIEEPLSGVVARMVTEHGCGIIEAKRVELPS